MLAVDARNKAINNTTVAQELAILMVAIAYAIEQKAVSVTVAAATNTPMAGQTVLGTPMLASQAYFEVWRQNSDDQTKLAEMTLVKDTLTALGYTVAQKADDANFKWSISW